MTTATYTPSQLTGFGAFGPEQLGWSMQAQTGMPHPFVGGPFAGLPLAGSVPFGGISPLPTYPQPHSPQQPYGVPQSYQFNQGSPFSQASGASQPSASQFGPGSSVAALNAVLWLQQHIAQQLSTLVALSQLYSPWFAVTPLTSYPQQITATPGIPFGVSAGQFGRPGPISY